MATWLKQSTAIEVKLGPFVSSSDGFTPMTALTITQADVRLAKNGGDWAQKAETTAAVHEENGWYRVLLNATDTGTTGILMLAVNETGALPVWREFMVVALGNYETLVEGLYTFEVTVTDTSPTVRNDISTAVWEKDIIGYGAMNNAAGNLLQTPSEVWGLSTTGHSLMGTFGAQAKTLIDTINSDTNTIKLAVDTEVAAIKAKTDSLTFTVAGSVDANVQRVNDTTVTGSGTGGSPWGP